MGLYNYWQEKLRSPLNEKKCFLCNNTLIPYNQTPELDCFQYKCPSCNPNVIIELSGSMLASESYDKLIANKKAVKALIKKIKACKKTNYEINTILVSKILKTHK